MVTTAYIFVLSVRVTVHLWLSRINGLWSASSNYNYGSSFAGEFTLVEGS
jgi:hypothetical protein